MSDKQNETEQLENTSGNVEQIREILFGGHIRAFDERFGLVEKRLAKETDALRKAMEKRVLELERLLGEYREEAGDLLGQESSNRDLALNKVELALGQSRVDAENQMAAMEDRFASELKQIRSDIKAMHKELSSALAKTGREQTKRAEKVEADTVARKDLADLLASMAKSLNPGKGSRGK